VFRWTFDTVPPEIADELKKDHSITAAVGLFEEGAATPMRSLLAELVGSVETVLKRFEVFVR